jgi:RNA polymerase sigma-70 factor (ECF subfamily)
VALSLEDFERHVAENVKESQITHAADLFLACACSHGDPRAIDHFSREFMKAVPAIVGGIVVRPELVDDLVQSLREMLLVKRDASSPPRIATYRGTGSLAGWVRISATRAAVRAKRRAGARAEQTLADDAELAPAPGLETQYLVQRYGPAFEAALIEAIAALPTAQRDILRSYYVEGLTIDELAARDGIHRATAARRVESARRQIFADVKKRAAERAGLPDDEVDSVLKLVVSRLEISLRRL